MFGFRPKSKNMLGIDISPTAVKLIELARAPEAGAEGFRVESFAIESLPVGALVDKQVADVDAVGQAIQQAVARAGTKAKLAAVAVTGAAVITKVVTMSAALSDSDLESQIQMEADQYIPYPLEEVSLDFQVIGPSKSTPSMVDVLLAASRRENVDSRLKALQIADLTATVVDIEAYAMENACRLLLSGPEDGPGQTAAVADVEATTTTVYVIQDGQVIYTREQNFGSQQLIDEFQHRHELTPEQATARVLNGEVSEEDEAALMSPFREALAQQIGRALQFFYSGTNASHLDALILAGSASGIAGVEELISKRLGLQTMIANPFAHMLVAPRINQRELIQQAPGLMVAVGLALRGFD